MAGVGAKDIQEKNKIHKMQQIQAMELVATP